MSAQLGCTRGLPKIHKVSNDQHVILQNWTISVIIVTTAHNK